MSTTTTAEMLALATAAVLDDSERSLGAAWLFSVDGHLLTAGHLVASGARMVPVRFSDDAPRRATVLFRALDDEIGVDFAILQVTPPVGRTPLRMSLVDNPRGRFYAHGYGVTLQHGSSANGEFVGIWDRQDSRHARLFKLQSTQLEQGFSGAAIYSEAEGAVVGLQISATTNTVGREANTALATPLYRVAKIWEDLVEVARGRLTVDTALLPAVESLIGRTRERDLLDKSLYQKGPTVVVLLGLAGIGKTTLVAQAVAEYVESGAGPREQLIRAFDLVSWKSMRSAQSFSEFAADLIALFAGYAEPARLSESQAITALVKLLAERPALIVLDNFDSLLVQEPSGSRYRPGCEGYGDLLRAMVSVSSRSKICLTTRELPVDLTGLTGRGKRFQVMRLGGVDWEAAREICSTQAALEGSAEEWREPGFDRWVVT